MFSKKLIYFMMIIFAFLSITTLIVNMPEKKDAQVIEKLKPYFPYEITKTIGGLDLIDKKTKEKLKVDNAKIFLSYDHYFKEWGKDHLHLQGSKLIILNDDKVKVDEINLKPHQLSFVKRFFFSAN